MCELMTRSHKFEFFSALLLMEKLGISDELWIVSEPCYILLFMHTWFKRFLLSVLYLTLEFVCHTDFVPIY